MARKKHEKKKKPQYPAVPMKYGGKWITWSPDESKILSSGSSPEEARNAAIAGGEEDPILEWVPPGLRIGFRR